MGLLEVLGVCIDIARRARISVGTEQIKPEILGCGEPESIL
jgi:hypothetical protein